MGAIQKLKPEEQEMVRHEEKVEFMRMRGALGQNIAYVKERRKYVCQGSDENTIRWRQRKGMMLDLMRGKTVCSLRVKTNIYSYRCCASVGDIDE